MGRMMAYLRQRGGGGGGERERRGREREGGREGGIILH